MRLGILGSTRGTNLTALTEAIANKVLAAKIAVVISNKSDAAILGRALQAGLPAMFINPEGLSREDYDNEITQALKEYAVDFIVLIGYMRILSPAFVQTWPNKIINVHPSLLPAHAGKMDLQVHAAVLEACEKQSGCSVHFVTEEVDAGPVIVQKRCDVLARDTKETLKARVQSLEGPALVEAINSFL